MDPGVSGRTRVQRHRAAPAPQKAAQHVAANMGSHSAGLVLQLLPSTEAQRQEAMKDFWTPPGRGSLDT